MDKTRDLILSLPLKEMEPSLLTHSITMRSRVFLPTYTEMTQCALQMASYLHRNATRSNRHNLPKDTYITHPLRNAERLFRYGVTDPEIIIATILHDTVEDCYEEMARDLAERGFTTPQSGRDIALDVLSETFNPSIAGLVEKVTNPISQPGVSKEDKRLQYFEHVVEIVQDPRVYLIKFTDWVDNAVGLHHNAQQGNEGMVTHLSQKYFPLVQVFEDSLTNQVLSLVDKDGENMIREHIKAGRHSLTALMQGIKPEA